MGMIVLGMTRAMPSPESIQPFPSLIVLNGGGSPLQSWGRSLSVGQVTNLGTATETSFAVFEKVFPGIAVQIIVLGSNWRNAPGLTTGEQRLNSCQFFVGDQHQLSPAGLHSALRQAELAPCTFFGTLHL